MLTRKHFEKIAAVLKSNSAGPDLVSDLADFCEDTNPNFDRDRFIEASMCQCTIHDCIVRRKSVTYGSV